MSIRRKAGQRGYNMVELMIAMAITTAMIAIIFSMIEEAMTLSMFVESHNDLTTMSQKALNTIQTEVLQSRTVFFEDAAGTSYRTKVESLLPACAYPCASSVWTMPPVADTLLSGMDPAPTLAPDPAPVRYTGNALLLARQLKPVPIAVIAEPGNTTNQPAFTFNADRYRFQYYYLTWHGSPSHKTFRNGSHILDLWQVRTIEYADFFQLANATANMGPGQKTDLATKLRTAMGQPTLYAWDASQPFNTAFWLMDNNLTFPAANQQGAGFNLVLASGGSMLPALLGGRIGGKMDYSVAYLLNRNANPSIRLIDRVPQNETRTNGRNALPLYAPISPALPLDAGFEVKIAGPPGSRQVMTRLLMYSNYRASRVDSTEAFVVTSHS